MGKKETDILTAKDMQRLRALHRKATNARHLTKLAGIRESLERFHTALQTSVSELEKTGYDTNDLKKLAVLFGKLHTLTGQEYHRFAEWVER